MLNPAPQPRTGTSRASQSSITWPRVVLVLIVLAFQAYLLAKGHDLVTTVMMVAIAVVAAGLPGDAIGRLVRRLGAGSDQA